MVDKRTADESWPWDGRRFCQLWMQRSFCKIANEHRWLQLPLNQCLKIWPPLSIWCPSSLQSRLVLLVSFFLLTEIILPPSPNFKRGKHGQKGPAVHFVKNVFVPLCILYTHCIDPSEYLFLFPSYGQKSKIFLLFTNFLCQPQKKLGDLLRAQFWALESFFYEDLYPAPIWDSVCC